MREAIEFERNRRKNFIRCDS